MKSKSKSKCLPNFLLIGIVLLVLIFITFSTYVDGSRRKVSAHEEPVPTKELSPETSNYTEVFSYKTILQSYYDNAKSSISNESEFCSLDDFTDRYYEQQLPIGEFTESIINQYTDESDASTTSSSSGGGYTLPSLSKTYNPEITPGGAFPAGRPKNNVFSKINDVNFTTIQEGDIVFETRNTFMNAGHCALVYEVGKSISGRSETYIQTIEAVDGKVHFGFLDEERLVHFGAAILRPNGLTSSKLEDVKYFCFEQVGDLYDFPLGEGRINTSIDADKWYCSELIYAAYKYAGITICSVYSAWCWPFDVYYGYNLKFASLFGCLEGRIYQKEGNKWTMRIYNPTNQLVTCEYNSKMCFENDAKNWRNLNDVNTTSINPRSYKDIVVTENFWATTIAIRKEVGSSYCITYFHSLNHQTSRFVMCKTIIESEE